MSSRGFSFLSFRFLLLLFLAGYDRVFHRFGHAELHDFLGRDLDRFAGGGIAAHASLAVHANQGVRFQEITNIPLFLVSRTAISVKVVMKCLAALVVVAGLLPPVLSPSGTESSYLLPFTSP